MDGLTKMASCLSVNNFVIQVVQKQFEFILNGIRITTEKNWKYSPNFDSIDD